MNWLAHIFVSENSIDYQLGNLLADPLKGKRWEGASPQLEDGFRMHGNIDAFTDSNELVLQSKARLGRRGYLKGVIIDIAYDYCLINRWDSYSTVPLERFIDTFYHNADVAIADYPPEARAIVRRIIASGVLTSYGSFDGLALALRRVDARLSDRVLARETATGYLPILKKEMTGIDRDFSRFFPQLVEYFKTNAGITKHHWLK